MGTREGTGGRATSTAIVWYKQYDLNSNSPRKHLRTYVEKKHPCGTPSKKPMRAGCLTVLKTYGEKNVA